MRIQGAGVIADDSEWLVGDGMPAPASTGPPVPWTAKIRVVSGMPVTWE